VGPALRLCQQRQPHPHRAEPAPSNTYLGDTVDDPVGATYSQIYNNASYFYVVWNNQFYASPIPNRDSAWRHFKGIVAWDKNGNGMVM
jgi:hypothetical protein